VDLIAKFAVRIKAIQCNQTNRDQVLNFFRRLGIATIESEVKGSPASPNGKQVLVNLNPHFEPWKLQPDDLRTWEKLHVSIVERY